MELGEEQELELELDLLDYWQTIGESVEFPWELTNVEQQQPPNDELLEQARLVG